MSVCGVGERGFLSLQSQSLQSYSTSTCRDKTFFFDSFFCAAGIIVFPTY